MAEKTAQLIKSAPNRKSGDELRLIPFIVAICICFSIAVILGTGSFILFNIVRGHQTRDAVVENAIPKQDAAETAAAKDSFIGTTTATPTSETPAPVPTATPVASSPNAVDGTVPVKGGEAVLGGGATKLPLRRVLVNDFMIAATEVTNAHYAEFVKETGHAAPAGWNRERFPKGTDNFPVVNVSWRDANAFCAWLSKKTNANVRLPNEAEWTLAARGAENLKYPWGNEWNKNGAISKETGGKVSPVAKSEINRSPAGAYDMVGNVWEWIEDKVSAESNVSDSTVKEALKGSSVLRIVKGSAAIEPAKEISAESRYEVPENTKAHVIGFRFVVEP